MRSHLSFALGDDLAGLTGRHGLVVFVPYLQLREGQRHAAGAQWLGAWHVGEPLPWAHHRNR